MTITVPPPKAVSPAAPDAAALPPGHPPVQRRRIGVLLSNLGTPDATDYWSMRRYLSEFLSDRRVIETAALHSSQPATGRTIPSM